MSIRNCFIVLRLLFHQLFTFLINRDIHVSLTDIVQSIPFIRTPGGQEKVTVLTGCLQLSGLNLDKM